DAPSPTVDAPDTKRLSMRLWVAAGVCLLAAMGLGMAQVGVVAPLVAIMLAVALGFIGWMQQLPSSSSEAQVLAPNARIGRGPYTTIDCEPDAKLVQELLSIVEQLRDAAVEEQWSIAWHDYSACINRGKEATQGRDYAAAVREYTSALR